MAARGGQDEVVLIARTLSKQHHRAGLMAMFSCGGAPVERYAWRVVEARKRGGGGAAALEVAVQYPHGGGAPRLVVPWSPPSAVRVEVVPVIAFAAAMGGSISSVQQVDETQYYADVAGTRLGGRDADIGAFAAALADVGVPVITTGLSPAGVAVVAKVDLLARWNAAFAPGGGGGGAGAMAVVPTLTSAHLAAAGGGPDVTSVLAMVLLLQAVVGVLPPGRGDAVASALAAVGHAVEHTLTAAAGASDKASATASLAKLRGGVKQACSAVASLFADVTKPVGAVQYPAARLSTDAAWAAAVDGKMAAAAGMLTAAAAGVSAMTAARAPAAAAGGGGAGVSTTTAPTTMAAAAPAAAAAAAVAAGGAPSVAPSAAGVAARAEALVDESTADDALAVATQAPSGDGDRCGEACRTVAKWLHGHSTECSLFWSTGGLAAVTQLLNAHVTHVQCQAGAWDVLATIRGSGLTRIADDGNAHTAVAAGLDRLSAAAEGGNVAAWRLVAKSAATAMTTLAGAARFVAAFSTHVPRMWAAFAPYAAEDVGGEGGECAGAVLAMAKAWLAVPGVRPTAEPLLPALVRACASARGDAPRLHMALQCLAGACTVPALAQQVPVSTANAALAAYGGDRVTAPATSHVGVVKSALEVAASVRESLTGDAATFTLDDVAVLASVLKAHDHGTADAGAVATDEEVVTLVTRNLRAMAAFTPEDVTTDRDIDVQHRANMNNQVPATVVLIPLLKRFASSRDIVANVLFVLAWLAVYPNYSGAIKRRDGKEGGVILPVATAHAGYRDVDRSLALLRERVEL